MSRPPVVVLLLLGILLLAVAPIVVTSATFMRDQFKKDSGQTEQMKEILPLAPHSPSTAWHHQGPFGTYDRAALQRGFQVYKQVCSVCHSMKLVSYRNLSDLGFNVAEVKALAADASVHDGPNDNGDMFDRPGRPSDAFVSPYPNDQAARSANGGALPPDLSLIIKARQGNENYVYSLLTGFDQPVPQNETMGKGMYYNPYFPGHQIAMPPPLKADAVTYADGTNATVEQEARDVTQFLTWAAEPKMEIRKQAGLKVVLFLIVFAGVMYGVKRRVWRKLH
jgi:ubiquinol-cytochrome c reductase cytochrome c1 subunit